MSKTVVFVWTAAILALAGWLFLLVNTVVKYERPSIFKGRAAAVCDERQQAIQGTAFKYGFLTAMTFFIFWMLTGALEVTLFTPIAGALIGLVVSAVPVVTICILSDAYFYVGENVAVKIGILNLPLVGWILLLAKMDWSGIVQNGVVTDEILYPLLSVFYLLIDILFIARYLQEKKRRAAAAQRTGSAPDQAL